jgi:hypothetical protein
VDGRGGFRSKGIGLRMYMTTSPYHETHIDSNLAVCILGRFVICRSEKGDSL